MLPVIIACAQTFYMNLRQFRIGDVTTVQVNYLSAMTYVRGVTFCDIGV